MSEIQERLSNELQRASESLRKWGAPSAASAALEQLAGQVYEPCVVALVGRMKSGKSSLVNALLGEDLAAVGVTETTATINCFRYGAADEARPVVCHWRNGRVTEETRRFASQLSGNDRATRSRAAAIEYLEYRLQLPVLKRTTLVDTPGLAAVVDEHEARTAEFMQTRRGAPAGQPMNLGRSRLEPDAVIYVAGAVARTTDQAFLDGLADAGGTLAKPWNSLGVLAKVDTHEAFIRRRQEIAGRIACQLKNRLNAVIPVSAGVDLVLRRLASRGDSALESLRQRLLSVPGARRARLLDDPEFFRDLDWDDCPFEASERRGWLGDLPWTAFAAVARELCRESLSLKECTENLESLAGMSRLRNILDRHFFQRSQSLRCHRILTDARRLLGEVRYEFLPPLTLASRQADDRRHRFLSFLEAAGDRSEVAGELSRFVNEHCQSPPAAELASALKAADRSLSDLNSELEEIEEDFAALVSLDDPHVDLADDEREELRCVLGASGLDRRSRVPNAPWDEPAGALEFVRQRQRSWNARTAEFDSPTAAIGRRAVHRLGLVLAEMLAG
jgi:hypothetical protein